MKLLTMLLSTVSAALLTACATHQGSLSNSIISSNATYKDITYGVSESKQLFGFGGISNDALVFEARKQLIQSRPLEANESYANVTVDIKRTKVIVYFKTKVTVTADIVEIHNDSTRVVYTQNYLNKLNQIKADIDLFMIGDSVVDKKVSKYIILGFENENKAIVGYTSDKNKSRTKKISINKIYTNKQGFKGREIGSIVDQDDAKGELIYVGLLQFLYLDKSDLIYSEKY